MVFILVLTTLSRVNVVIGASEKPYQFGVFPYLSPLRLEKIFVPISQELSKTLGQPVKFRTSSNLPRFRERLGSEYYDFAIVQPVLYPFAVDQLGYIPLVRIEEQVFSVIMVLASSPLTSVEDLKGKKIATPPVFGPVVSLAKRSFIENGISPETDISLEPNKTVGSCLQKVLAKLADACIAPNFAVKPFEQTMGVKLRTLLGSRGIPNQALLVHPRVPLSDRDRLRQEFLSWRFSIQGQNFLRALNSQGFVEVDDSEYDIVREFVRELK